MSISDFASTINLPLANYFEQINQYKTNSNKDKIAFLSGDATVYGQDRFSMPQKGYQLFKKHVKVQMNHGYTMSSGTVKAREAILKLYKPQFNVAPSNVFINHGAHMSLMSTVMAFTNPGDEILVPEIGYPFFTNVCPALKIKAVPYKLKKQQNFQIDLEHAKTLINQKTQFIFVVNPSNPMGSIFSEKHMKQIINFADQNQLPIVADQVYLRQSFPNQKHLSFGQVTVDVPVIAICGVQKVLSTPGWCTSWQIIFDKNGYLNSILKNIGVLCTIFLHTNRLTQQALSDILEQVGLHTHDKMDIIEVNHNYVIQKVKNLNNKIVKPIIAQGTIYISLEITDFSQLKNIKNDQEFTKLFFEQQNVSLLPLSVFGEALQGLRLLTCAKKQLYDELFVRLNEFLIAHKA